MKLIYNKEGVLKFDKSSDFIELQSLNISVIFFILEASKFDMFKYFNDLHPENISSIFVTK